MPRTSATLLAARQRGFWSPTAGCKAGLGGGAGTLLLGVRGAGSQRGRYSLAMGSSAHFASHSIASIPEPPVEEVSGGQFRQSSF